MSNSTIQIPTGVASINDLTDVTTTGVVDGQTLCYDAASGEWLAVDKITVISDLGDVDSTGVTDGQVLCYDSASGNFIPQDKENQDQTLDEHTDVTLTAPADNDTLCYDAATSQWVNVPKTNQDQALDDHTDVTLTTVQDLDTLCYDAATSQWINVPKSTVPSGIDDLTDVDCPTHVAGDILVSDGTNFVCGQQAIDDHSDVNLTAPTDGQTICYDAATSQWVNVDKESNKCCFPDPGGFSVGDPVRIDNTGAVVASDISNTNTVAQFIVVSTDGTEICLQNFGTCELAAPHGFTVGDCAYEDTSGGTTTTAPTTGINNILYHVISPTKLSIVAGTRPFEFV
jgi:hypothetical protein